MTTAGGRRRYQALVLFVALLVIYNLNGRESGSADSQPAKFLAAGVALRHTLTLDAIVAERPGLAERTGFKRDRDGHWRSAYPIMPGLIAAVPAVLLQLSGAVQMDAPLAPNLIAKLTASLLTAAAVALLFLSLTRIVRGRHAMLTAVGIGLGTNYWATVSQTLGQHETVAFGFSVALWAWWRTSSLSRTQLVMGAAGLAIAGAARPQVAPVIVALVVGMGIKEGWRRMGWPLGLIAGVAAMELGRNVIWFGHPLGAVLQIESVHPLVHGVAGTLAEHPWANAAALLVSPSRGLLIFSPIVVIALVGLWMRGLRPEFRWFTVAICLQFPAYACYSVWWGGHSFGPRYLLDLLVLLAPFGAVGVAALANRPLAAGVATIALIWSVAASGLGAFVYPNERWNSEPLDVDRYHERLWEWSDSQLQRASHTDQSPQNFSLFDRTSVRLPPRPPE